MAELKRSDQDSNRSHFTQSRAIESFLLGSELVDALSLEKLASFFPHKFRDAPEIRELHILFHKFRKRNRSQVKKNIEETYGLPNKIETLEQLQEIQLDEAIGLLSQKKRKLEKQERDLEKEKEQIKMRMKKASINIIEKSINITPFNLNPLQESTLHNLNEMLNRTGK
eukprot:TRINITY_DN8454_c0_g1_i1.p1 TRINITY_DN8454_c0_g1~~TRINITY_DN8454_c0_g1_i1.p1  ORF type:complete len:169 (-),score=25.93 TRINITY_DN8454_c0_g1_i1:126-632(-)